MLNGERSEIFGVTKTEEAQANAREAVAIPHWGTELPRARLVRLVEFSASSPLVEPAHGDAGKRLV